jgi:hypothetical protein
MKILPTAASGLCIEVEDPGDWLLLKGITHDAVSCEEKLAHRLGKLIIDPAVAPDWRDYIVPDLEAGFSAHLITVASAIAAARVESGGGPGPLWITGSDTMDWYSALNQARLALEDRFHFGPAQNLDPLTLAPERRAAFLRSQFYGAIQSLLLELGLP